MSWFPSFATKADDLVESAIQSGVKRGDTALRSAFANIQAGSLLYRLSVTIENSPPQKQQATESQVTALVAEADTNAVLNQNSDPAAGIGDTLAGLFYKSTRITLPPKDADYLSRCNDVANKASETSLNVADLNAPEEIDPEQYSTLVTRTLHCTFHKDEYLPCYCTEHTRTICLLDDHICALRLDGNSKLPGDETHFWFDSAIRNKRDTAEPNWRAIQFQIPKSTREVAFKMAAKQVCDENPVSDVHNAFKKLEDFCELLQTDNQGFQVPLRLQSKGSQHTLYKLDLVPPTVCAVNRDPILLLTALTEHCLSVKSKITLAYVLAKSIWDYYESDWMKSKWDLQNIQFLPEESGPDNYTFQPGAPFLSIKHIDGNEQTITEHENGENYAHRYPLILKLGLLLVQICTQRPEERGVDHSGYVKANTEYFYCCRTMRTESWPAIDLSEEHKNMYRKIVARCIPTNQADLLAAPLFDKTLDTAGRRMKIKDLVVRPLYALFQGMECRHDNAVEVDRNKELIPPPAEDSTSSRAWLQGLKCTWLHQNVVRGFKKTKTTSRPKVVVIDTGYDASSSFIDRPKKDRLGFNHWKDFWDENKTPIDSSGHGTSMLSAIMDVAPFADFAVARIANDTKDLINQKERTSQNLARAIEWAVDQCADIISISCGWTDEPRVNKRSVVSNAICAALASRDQKVLFFAAASNFGGGEYELFPAKELMVFSIRGTNSVGEHDKRFNPSLDKTSTVKVFGTLGVDVPTASRGKTEVEVIRTGTSIATAIAAGIAALLLGYINLRGENSWEKVKEHKGFGVLMDRISTEPEARKCFITLQQLRKEKDLETALDVASVGR